MGPSRFCAAITPPIAITRRRSSSITRPSASPVSRPNSPASNCWRKTKGKNMKKMAIGLIAGLALLQAGAAESQWLTDLPKAQAKAKEEKKLVMLDFTGSDWCGWCIKLHKEVFSKPEFAEYAKKNLVLVEVDFPRQKEQPAELKKANQKLQEKYKIEGYPTLVV